VNENVNERVIVAKYDFCRSRRGDQMPVLPKRPSGVLPTATYAAHENRFWIHEARTASGRVGHRSRPRRPALALPLCVNGETRTDIVRSRMTPEKIV
jgi:hypothetical protein